MIISMSVQNLLNHTNPGPIIGDITSPLFGFANKFGKLQSIRALCRCCLRTRESEICIPNAVPHLPLQRRDVGLVKVPSWRASSMRSRRLEPISTG
jgi:hypothetical protein